MRIAARADSGAACRIESPEVLAEAVKHPLTADVLAEQFGRLGGTAYQLRGLDARIEGRPDGAAERAGAVAARVGRGVGRLAARRPPLPTAADSPLPALRDQPRRGLRCPDSAPPQLHVLCRRREQIEPVIAAGVTSLMADFEDPDQYAGAVAVGARSGSDDPPGNAASAKAGRVGKRCGALAPRGRRHPAANLAAAALSAAEGVPFVADFSLHAANELTVQFLHESGRVPGDGGLRLPARSNSSLWPRRRRPSGSKWWSISTCPCFIRQHCIFSALLSSGGGKDDCGRPAAGTRFACGIGWAWSIPCGRRRPAATRCFTASRRAWPTPCRRCSSGVRHFRLELLDETEGQIGRLLQSYLGTARVAIAGKFKPTGCGRWRRHGK